MPSPSVTDVAIAPLGPMTGPRHIRVSVGVDGIPTGDALGGDVSADGRYVVFLSTASNLVAGDNNGAPDIFRKDLLTGVVELVSATAAGVVGHGASGLAAGATGVGASNWSMPTISENGRFVGFVSAAQNLPGAIAGAVHGYVKDMVTGTVLNLSQTLLPALGPAGALLELGAQLNKVSMGESGRARVQLENVPPGVAEFWEVAVNPAGYSYVIGTLPNTPQVPSFFGLYGYGRPGPTLTGAIGPVSGWDVPTTRLLSWTLDNIPALGDSNGLGDVILTGPGGARVISRQLSGPGGTTPAESNQTSYPGFLSRDGSLATFFTDAVNIEAGAATPGGGLIVSGPTTVWAYSDPSPAAIAARAAAIAENRTASLSFGVDDATSFRVTWGDGTSTSGSTGLASEIGLEKTYAANGSYTIVIRLTGPDGVVNEAVGLHLLDRATAAFVSGSNRRDIVFAGEQDDTIEGRGGDDVIHAGGGNDLIVAGAGADTVFGGAGNDTFADGRGLAFPDVYVGGAGVNTVNYATTREALTIRLTGEALEFGATEAGSGTVHTLTGPVTDRLFDIQNVIGGDGENLIYGSAEANVIRGGRLGDYLAGEEGNDSLWGGAGNDVLRGGPGDDTLEGGDGHDQLIVTGGQSVAHGGGGRNSLLFEYDMTVDDSSVWVVDMVAGLATRAADGARVIFSGITEMAGVRGLEVTGTAANETFLLNEYASVFHGGGGFNTLSAREIFIGFVIDASAPTGTAQSSFGGREGGPAVTTFTRMRGFEGSQGHDTIIGSASADRISGLLGDDVLEGGPGQDTLIGGWGADAFVLGLHGTADTVEDFVSETDQIWVRAADVGLPAGALDPARFTFGPAAVGPMAQFVHDAATGAFFFDADGDGGQVERPMALLGIGRVVLATDVLIV
ncbi:hypothetical protein KTR66_14160 [Roseococcus sp. SDR]|uniref:calcium-binding protein n=1 Tax=Roseococcus sp. SDR TaxID=2835532 RepID=UPI001BCB521F|nr:calcium-binding protein [Roseococcus sp. SDR]MBS7791143.1 hypothetical protein [Roseococcus sp. SDR]MBV1846457.1 hypothetical protein [Roseococcus sp. SDR]